MHFYVVSFSLFSAAALAAPAKRGQAVSMAASDGAQWTLQNVTRTCSADSSACDWSYGVFTGSGSSTPCFYNVTGSPATQAPVNGVKCGNFTLSSSWSGQFGPDEGFTTISVIENNQIAYPAYKDTELKNGTAVSPDRSYPVQNLPSQ